MRFASCTTIRLCGNENGESGVTRDVIFAYERQKPMNELWAIRAQGE
ncbi:hypothetical protein [Bartonella apihabitans]|nr:hypothetical protein [Bartonella apihabitans]MBI0025177.1 hypothetical protein [Bartonella apihabitans]